MAVYINILMQKLERGCLNLLLLRLIVDLRISKMKNIVKNNVKNY